MSVTDDDLQGQIAQGRRSVATVISSLSTAPTDQFADGGRRIGRTDDADDLCEAELLGVHFEPDPDTDPDSDDEGETELDRRLPARRRKDPDADLHPDAELVSAEAELDLVDDVRRLADQLCRVAEAADLSLAIGSRLLRRARPAVWPAASVVAVVSALLVLVGALTGAVFTLAGCLLVLG